MKRQEVFLQEELTLLEKIEDLEYAKDIESSPYWNFIRLAYAVIVQYMYEGSDIQNYDDVEEYFTRKDISFDEYIARIKTLMDRDCTVKDFVFLGPHLEILSYFYVIRHTLLKKKYYNTRDFTPRPVSSVNYFYYFLAVFFGFFLSMIFFHYVIS